MNDVSTADRTGSLSPLEIESPADAAMATEPDDAAESREFFVNNDDNVDDEDEDDYDDEGDFRPLVSTRQRRNSKQSKQRRRRGHRGRMIQRLVARDDETSCLGDCARAIGSLFLATLLFGPYVYFHVREHIKQDFSAVDDIGELPDTLKCAEDGLKVNFTELFLQMKTLKTSDDFCATKVVPTTNKKHGKSMDSDKSDHVNRDRGCSCTSPLIPASNTQNVSKWWTAQKRNRDMANDAAQSTEPLDVVFFGDSITEQWQGTRLFHSDSSDFDGIAATFQQHFGGKATDAPFHGIPLGISGDQSNEVLYRIQEGGELPDNLQAKVYWLLIGTNDMGWSGCSPESVLVANMVLAKLLSKKKPGARVVLNSILPRDRKDIRRSVFNENIRWINERLGCFASGVENVTYFNTDDIFLPGNKTMIDPALMGDYLHPSTLGATLWADAISNELKELIV